MRQIDTPGAGDCLAGAYLTRLPEGADVAEALQFANAAAALATLDFGAQTAMPLRGAVEKLLATSGRGPQVPFATPDKAYPCEIAPNIEPPHESI